ncbi:MAG: hydroxyacylglutathione hydrolase [Pseudomonadota bacterium]
MPLQVKQFPCLMDNYGFLVRDEATKKVAAIDTPEAEKINEALEEAGWQLDLILNTHHHWDHTGGNIALKEKWNCKIIGPRSEADKIPGIDQAVSEGEHVSIGDSKASVFETPGHTAGHIVFHFKDDGLAFVGDTLFALGCGRLFEGTPQQMWQSLLKVRAWPQDTVLYCAHEYTEGNSRFAVSLEPENERLKARAEEIALLRSDDTPTVPTTLATECATNPFLRADDPVLRAALHMEAASDLAVFTEVRQRKDNF